MLELRDVHTYYGNIRALDGVSLTVAQNDLVTLIGANGAGKSTTPMSVCGLVPPRAGDILFEGDMGAFLRTDTRRIKQDLDYVLPNIARPSCWSNKMPTLALRVAHRAM